ncbi:MAG TPA: hypothetical protein VHX42_01985 [Candidatus Babeliales bacterium]|nr:hypothetical protein [Candidatus Babeliales bacterium]
MKKVTVACIIICFFLSNHTLSMFTKYSTLSQRNIFKISNCHYRSEFDLPRLLQQLRKQKREAEEQAVRTQEQIELMEICIKNQPIHSNNEQIATAAKIEDRDFPHGNMNKDH